MTGSFRDKRTEQLFRISKLRCLPTAEGLGSIRPINAA
jgi:hypothetical protein